MLNMEPAILIARVIVLLIALPVHELAHAWTADWFGDDTPRLNGRLSPNPLVHLDPLGSIMILVAGFGWAKPVPVNLYALERRSQFAPLWVAFAGPLSNLLLAVLGAIPLRFGLVALAPSGAIFPSLSQLLFQFVWLNLVLFVFNLIPIFPLDGEKILTYLLPYNSQGRKIMDQLRPIGPFLLILLFIVPNFVPIINPIGWVISVPVNTMLNLLL